jgi:hypothetical protein
MKIVGILGFAGSGKDTVGSMLIEAGYEKASFASTLKDAVSIIFNWDREMLEGSTKESREWRERPDEYWSRHLGYNVTPRLILQRFGTEAGRNVLGENIWVYSLLRSLDSNKKYVITDVRFPNEISMIKSVGGTLIRVKRGPEPEWYDVALAQNKGDSDKALMPLMYPHIHPSEFSWVGTEVDETFHNDSSLNDLREKVFTFMSK